MREIDATFGRERAKAIFDLAWGAGARVHDRIVKHDIKCDLKSGHLEAAYKPGHFDDMQREVANFWRANLGGIRSRLSSLPTYSKHINGGDYHGGLYDSKGGHFHPLNYALGLAKAALAAGVSIFEHTAAQTPLDRGSHVAIAAGTGSLNCLSRDHRHRQLDGRYCAGT